jgi:hypothetical protein
MRVMAERIFEIHLYEEGIPLRLYVPVGNLQIPAIVRFYIRPDSVDVRTQ